MPGMDGEAVAGVIRKEQPDLPIVLLTGVPRDLLESRLVSLVDAVVIKGEPAEVLLTALERLTRTKRGMRPAKKAGRAGEGNSLQDAIA
jgi:CheY-like chemotaxis protein